LDVPPLRADEVIEELPLGVSLHRIGRTRPATHHRICAIASVAL